MGKCTRQLSKGRREPHQTLAVQVLYVVSAVLPFALGARCMYNPELFTTRVIKEQSLFQSSHEALCDPCAQGFSQIGCHKLEKTTVYTMECVSTHILFDINHKITPPSRNE